ncbi:7-keto-8-aminopelargonate synthetase-like enzyme [Bradyrhizobium sp. AZCC 2176]
MNYDGYFQRAPSRLRDERRYRVFADLEHRRALSPRHLALACAPAQRRDLVLQRLPRDGAAPEGDRRHGRNRDPHGHRRGAARVNIAGTSHPLVELERELADLHGEEAAFVFTSGYGPSPNSRS